MYFDSCYSTNFINNSLQQELYGYSSQEDFDISKFRSSRMEYQDDDDERPVEYLNMFKDCDDLKMATIPLPDDEKEFQIDLSVADPVEGIKQIEPQSMVMVIESTIIKPASEPPVDIQPRQPPVKKLNDYYKNFLVILSGWLRNHFVKLVQKRQMSKDLFNFFERVVIPPPKEEQEESLSSKTAKKTKRKKIYINLKKFSTLFNHEGLKPYLSNFLSSHFLRYLASSKTKNKACLLRFLPVLKQGLIEGKIVRLR